MTCSPSSTPLSMGFPRQGYCSGLPFPSPGDLPDPGMEPASPALAGGFFTTEQPGVKEINPEYSLEGLLLKLKLQYFGNLMRRANSLKNTLMLTKPEGKRRKEQQRIRWFESITNSVDMNLSKLPEVVEDRGAWCAAVYGATKRWTRLSNWTKTLFALGKLCFKGQVAFQKTHGHQVKVYMQTWVFKSILH